MSKEGGQPMTEKDKEPMQFRLFQEEDPRINRQDALSRLKQTGLPAKRVREGQEMLIARREEKRTVKKRIKAVKKKLEEISAAYDRKHQKYTLRKRIADLP